MSKSALKELPPVDADAVRQIVISTHAQIHAPKFEELIEHLTNYRRLTVEKLARGVELSPQENEQLGAAMIPLEYLDADGTKLANDVDLIRQIEFGYSLEIRDEAKFRAKCEEMHRKAQDAELARQRAITAANAAHSAAKLAENEQMIFEMTRREYLSLKKHNARMFGTLEEALDPNAPNIGTNINKIREWGETHRTASESSPNYLPAVSFRQ